MMHRGSRRLGRSIHRSPNIGAKRRLAAAAACGALALSGLLPAAPLALGASGPPTPEASVDTSSIRWTVKPADGRAVDGRTRVEAAMEPGSTLVEHVAVKNLSDVEATFILSAADGYFNRNGRFDMLSADQESVDAGTWIELEESVTVPARTTAVVPFTITVPDDAAPGGHEAGVAASVLTDRGTMQVMSRVGVRVAIDVSGEVVPGLNLEVTGVTYQMSWNPFSSGRLEIRLSLSNGGVDTWGGSGTATTRGWFGLLSSESAFDVAPVAPGQSRQQVVLVDGVWPVIRDGVDLVLTQNRGEGSDAVTQPSVDATVGFWAIPWPHLVVVLVVAMAVRLSPTRRGRAPASAGSPTDAGQPQDGLTASWGHSSGPGRRARRKETTPVIATGPMRRRLRSATTHAPEDDED